MARLLRAVQDLSLARSLEEVQIIVRTAARELTHCDGASFVLRDNGKCYYLDEDAIEPLWKGMRFPMEACVSGWSMLNRKQAIIPDIYTDERVPHEAYRPTFVKSMVMVPIRTASPIGAIGNYWADQRHPGEHEVALLQALADSTSIAMENVAVYAELEQRVIDRTAQLVEANAEIQRLSLTDELTKLNNRRGFFHAAEAALAASRRRDEASALVFIDVDGLKPVNDKLGHEMGDQLIVDMARVLQSTLREADVVARLGGDEFCALLVDTDHTDVVRARLEQAIARFNAESNRPYRLSASMGIAESPATDSSSLDRLMAIADELMYEVKRTRSTR